MDELSAYGVALLLWFAMGVVAVANGYCGSLYVEPRVGEYGNHVYKSVVAIATIGILAWLWVVWTQEEAGFGTAVGIGLLWAGLAMLFEFGFGRYGRHLGWDVLLADYRLWRGRLWSVVLLAMAVAPPMMVWWVNR
jgi:hypothetical protein